MLNRHKQCLIWKIIVRLTSIKGTRGNTSTCELHTYQLIILQVLVYHYAYLFDGDYEDLDYLLMLEESVSNERRNSKATDNNNINNDARLTKGWKTLQINRLWPM